MSQRVAGLAAVEPQCSPELADQRGGVGESLPEVTGTRTALGTRIGEDRQVRLPYRQVYGPAQAVTFGSLFAATVSIVDIREWPDYRPVIALPKAREPRSARAGSAR